MGFNTEQFVENVDENLKCSICLDVLEDPWQCKDGHIYCKGCITQWLNRNRQTCPVCKNALRVKDLARNLGIKNIVENLEVYCHLSEEEEDVNESELKCAWTGKLQSLGIHRETCPFQQVQCPNEGCNATIQRRELEDHDNVCEHKLLICDEQCGLTVIRRDLPNHKKNDCPEVRLACPNDCGTGIKRKDITTHRETCPNEQVQCPNVNCIIMIDRNKLEYHDKICVYKTEECGKCSKVLVRLEVEYHKDFECPEELVPCPKSCRCPKTEQPNKIKRIDLDWHMKNDCARIIFDCPFKEHGCSVQVERQHVDKHIQDNMAAHLMLLAKQCSSLTKQNSTLNEQNTTVTEQCSALTEKCSTLAQENRSLKQELNRIKKNLENVIAEIPNTYTWTIRDFRSRAKKSHLHFFRSPTFWLCGHCWYLKIYPRGKRDHKGYLALYLFACCNDSTHETSEVVVPNDGVSVFFRLKVLSQDMEDLSYKTENVFSYEEGKQGFGWHFMKTDLALSPAYCSNDGTLTVQCMIRPAEPQ